MKKYKFEDIKPNTLVTLELHNGKGRSITYRRIFVNYVGNSCIAYDYTKGSMFESKKELEFCKTEIVDIKELE